MAERIEGKRVLITGATSGIGQVTARELVRQGAHLVFTARNAEKARRLAQALRTLSPSSEIDFLVADLSLMREVEAAAAEYRRRFDRLDILVNNAGAIYMRRETTGEGLERTFATNHLAPFLLTYRLMDLLRASSPARVVNVASRAHTRGRMYWEDLELRRGYSGWKAYQQSKLANVLFTRELARRLRDSGVTANALHPGVVSTGFGMNSKGPFMWVWQLAGRLFLTPEEGARTSIFLAMSPDVEGHTGGYYDRSREISPSRRALSDEDARRLWDESERMVARALAGRAQ